jgi:diguanylate cyclase (GGDEF)-like protein
MADETASGATGPGFTGLRHMPLRTRVLIGVTLTTVLPMLVLVYIPITYLPGLGLSQHSNLQLLTASTALLMLAGTLVVWDLAREVQRVNARWRDLSLTDELTGIYNRRYCDRRVREEVARARRHAHPLALLLLDLDRFKTINDRHGHAVGDAVLRRLASVITRNSRAETGICRYGGDEFAIVLPETPRAGALIYAERIRATVEVSVFPKNEPVTISIGLGVFPDDAETMEDLFKAADTSLYVAKDRGRNQVGA